MAGLAGDGAGSACPRQHDPEAERIIRDADRPRTNLRLAWKEFKPVGACDRQPVKISGQRAGTIQPTACGDEPQKCGDPRPRNTAKGQKSHECCRVSFRGSARS